MSVRSSVYSFADQFDESVLLQYPARTADIPVVIRSPFSIDKTGEFGSGFISCCEEVHDFLLGRRESGHIDSSLLRGSDRNTYPSS